MFILITCSKNKFSNILLHNDHNDDDDDDVRMIRKITI